MKKIIVKVTGMHCNACEALVGESASLHPLVKDPVVNLSAGTLEVTAGEELDPLSFKDYLNKSIQTLGYQVYLESENPRQARFREILLGLGIGLVFLALFALVQFSGLVSIFQPEELTLPAAFLLGIMASVSSCFALVGGLLVTYTAEVGSRYPRQLAPGLTAFHISRLGTFFIFGGLLGHLGNILALEPWVFNWLYGAAAMMMTVLGFQLMGIIPPRGKMKKNTHVKRAKNLAGAGTAISGLLLGAGTFFLPCGFTQSMQFQALGSGSFMEGGLLLLTFALGTLPVLLTVSFFLGKGLLGNLRSVILRSSGVVVMGLGLYQLYNVFILMGWWRP